MTFLRLAKVHVR